MTKECPRTYEDCQECPDYKGCSFLWKQRKEKKPPIREKNTMETWDSWYDVELQRTKFYRGER